MNKKVILSWLSLVMLVVTSALVPLAPANTLTSTSGSAFSSGVLAPNQNFGAGHGDNGDDGDDGDNGDGKTPTSTPTNIPQGPVAPDDKPDLTNPADLSDRPLSTVIGFTFPSGISGGWTIPLEAAAFEDIIIDSSETFTPVGIVVIDVNRGSTNHNGDNHDSDDNGSGDNGSDDNGSESQQPKFRIFSVEIDVTSTSDVVPGRLVSTTSTQIVNVNFTRIPQIINPQREEAIYPEFQLDFAPNNIATIASDTVCFVVDTGEDGFIRYCSTGTRLSVMDSFPTQYTELKSMIVAAAANIGYQSPLALNQTISTIEDTQRTQDCANASGKLAKQTTCVSDIIVAPVTRDYFEQKYNQKFGGGDGNNGDNGGDGENGNHESQTVSRDTASIAAKNNNGENDDHSKNNDNGDNDNGNNKPNKSPTSIDIAAVKVLHPIEFSNGIVQPGDYRLDVWFDVNGVFFAATLTGLTTSDSPVVNQQIPAIPKLFIDASDAGPRQPFAQISSFCIDGWCSRK